MKRRNGIIYGLMIIVGILAFFNWNISKENKINEELRLQLLYRNFMDLNQQIDSLGQTLDMYREDFTDQEKALFHNALVKDRINLQRIERNMGRLDKGVFEDLKFILYFLELRGILGLIARGEIVEESEIKNISTILSQHGKTFEDMIFKELIGTDGMKDQETVDRILLSMEEAYKQLNKISGLK